MKLLFHELKLLLAAYKRILSGISVLALFCALIIALTAALPGTMLFAPFTVGIVDNDNSSEVTLLLEILKSTESLSKVVDFERMSAETATSKLASDEIPAYITVPSGFTQSVMTGENLPLTLVGNESRVIQLSVTKLLVGAGVAFLTTSQSGIYSTLDYAYEQGLSWDEVNNNLVMPINIEYMKALLAYDDYFAKTELSATDGLSRGEYYRNSALIFLMEIFLITLMSTLLASTGRTAMRRYRMCGVPLLRVMLTKWAALWLLLSALLLPACILFGARVFAAAVLLSGLALMCSQLFESEQAAGLFLFSFAVVTLFAAGGALPLAYLPDVFGRISLFMPNYWFIRINEPLSAAVFCGYGVLFFGIAFLKMKRCTE